MAIEAQENGAERRDRFARVFDVLELLVRHPEGMKLTEISNRLELPTSSAHNLLQRMVGADVVTVDEELRYGVGPRAVRLSIRIVDGLELRGIARRYLQDLARETGEDIYLAVRVGLRVVYVERIPGTRAVTVEIKLGQPLFLHATSVGKLFSAHNPQMHRLVLAEPRPALTDHTVVSPEALEHDFETIRRQGYAISREEAMLGIVGLAVPVFDAAHDLVAAIHVSAIEAQLTPAHERAVLEAASAAADAIARELGRHQPVTIA